MKEKSYGEKVRSYLQNFATSPAPAFTVKHIGPKTATPKKPRAKKDDGPQQALPL
jgi:hypothetical protein